MKKLLAWVKFYIKWLFYLWATQDEKLLYSLAQSKGYYCEGYRNGIAKYDTRKPPQEKSWITYSEYKDRWNPVNGRAVFFVGPKISEYDLFMRRINELKTQ